MFDNIGGKLKSLAKKIAIAGTVIGVLCFLISVVQYAENAEYIDRLDSSFSSLREAAVIANRARTGIFASLGLILASIVSSWPLYGYGQLIENSDKILKHLEGKNNDDHVASKSVIEDIEANLPEM